MTLAILLLIALIGGCYSTTPQPIEVPVKVGFWVENINNNKEFVELPFSFYQTKQSDSNIKVIAKGCSPFEGKSSSIIVLEPDPVFWLASVIWAEARGESLAGQAAVGQVILNRVEDSRFNNSIVDVIFESSSSGSSKLIRQFSCITDGQLFKAADAVDFPHFITLAKNLMKGIQIEPKLRDALGFFNPSRVQAYDPLKTNWVWKQPVLMQIGNHVFFDVP